MIFSVHIGTDNAAFWEGDVEDFAPGPELARILRELADQMPDRPVPDQPLRLRDVNGNRVGFAVLNSDGIGNAPVPAAE